VNPNSTQYLLADSEEGVPGQQHANPVKHDNQVDEVETIWWWGFVLRLLVLLVDEGDGLSAIPVPS